jgi:NADH-quinone oxidoreductase subunit F
VLEIPYVVNYLTEHFGEEDYPTIDGYERVGGYRSARKALTEMSPDEVIQLVKTAGLQGR